MRMWYARKMVGNDWQHLKCVGFALNDNGEECDCNCHNTEHRNRIIWFVKQKVRLFLDSFKSSFILPICLFYSSSIRLFWDILWLLFFQNIFSLISFFSFCKLFSSIFLNPLDLEITIEKVALGTYWCDFSSNFPFDCRICWWIWFRMEMQQKANLTLKFYSFRW